MRADQFLQIAGHFGLKKVTPFSQKRWRKKVYLKDPGKLCAGLCDVWFSAMLSERFLLKTLEAPKPELLQYICWLQALNYYPDFPESYKLVEQDKQRLLAKYASSDWQAIKRMVFSLFQGDFILYDLSQRIMYDKAVISRFDTLPQFTCWENIPRYSVVLGVLRYKKNGRSRGHRFGYYLDANGNHCFFDPNAGEVTEACSQRFYEWLNYYCRVSGYHLHEKSETEPLLSLYHLHGVTLKIGQDLRDMTDLVLKQVS